MYQERLVLLSHIRTICAKRRGLVALDSRESETCFGVFLNNVAAQTFWSVNE